MTERELAEASPMLEDVLAGMRKVGLTLSADEMDEMDPRGVLRRVLSRLDQTDASSFWRVDVGPVEHDAVKARMHRRSGPSRDDIAHMRDRLCAVVYPETTILTFPGDGKVIDVVLVEEDCVAWTTAEMSVNRFDIGDIFCIARRESTVGLAKSVADRVHVAFVGAVACVSWRRSATT